MTRWESSRQLSIAIIGTRGIPGAHGGFETFAEELSWRLVRDYGWEVLVVGDADHQGKGDKRQEWRGVKTTYSRWSKRRQPFRFYFESIRIAAQKSEVILVCGCGIALGSLFARSLGVPVLLNPDGLEWKRQKWSVGGRLALRILTLLSIHSANLVVCDSLAIRQHLAKGRLRKRAFVAEYGADLDGSRKGVSLAAPFELSGVTLRPWQYYIVVARLEPENNIQRIVAAYENSQSTLPLVIIGGLENSPYVRKLLRKRNGNVHFVGSLYNREKLAKVRKYCRAYLHGHSVGGTNPSLLESMAVGSICICHDNEFNTETTAGHALFFADTESLATIIRTVDDDAEFEKLRILGRHAKSRVRDIYSWPVIARRYVRAIRECHDLTAR